MAVVLLWPRDHSITASDLMMAMLPTAMTFVASSWQCARGERIRLILWWLNGCTRMTSFKITESGLIVRFALRCIRKCLLSNLSELGNVARWHKWLAERRGR